MNLGRPRIWTQIHKSQPPEYSFEFVMVFMIDRQSIQNVQAPDLITKLSSGKPATRWIWQLERP